MKLLYIGNIYISICFQPLYPSFQSSVNTMSEFSIYVRPYADNFPTFCLFFE